jgi:hypothetical protein
VVNIGTGAINFVTSAGVTKRGLSGLPFKNTSAFVYKRPGVNDFGIFGGGASADTIAPTITSAIVSNASPSIIALTLSETCQAQSAIASPGWTVTGSTSGSHTVNTLSISGSSASIATDINFVNGEVITISYSGSQIKDTAGNVLASFSNMNVTNNVAVVVPSLTFGTKTNETVASGMWTNTAGGTAWNGTGLDAKKLPAGQDGYIMMDTDGSVHLGMIGFKSTNTEGDYTTFDVAIWVGNSTDSVPNKISAIDTVSGTPHSVRDAIWGYTAGNKVRINVHGRSDIATTQFDIEESSDGITWLLKATLNFKTVSDLYVVNNIRGDGSILNPKGYGLV